MKTKHLFLIGVALIVCVFVSRTFGQSSKADLAGAGLGHANTGSEYLGFNNAFGPLNIKNSGTTYIELTTAGFVGIGYTTPPTHLTITTYGAALYGTIPTMAELLVAGGIYNDNTGWQTVAEFQSVNENNNSVGIGVRGSRNANQNADCAYIDLKNYYKDGGCDFSLARMSADVRRFGCTDDASGYYRLKIADGTASGGYNLAMFADYNGQVGIGLGFTHNPSPPTTRLEVWDFNTAVAQFRITQDYANGIFSDFTTFSTGDLLINPTNAGAFQKVGIDLSISDLPTEVLDVNGNGRFRNVEPTLTPVTDDFLIWGERDAATAFGTLHRLPFSGANSDILHGDGTWGPVGDVTACTGGAIANKDYIARFTSANEICKSEIYEHPTLHTIGVHTTSSTYSFHNFGSAMFERNGISAACATYNGNIYPLAVVSFNGGATGPSGLGIFSTGAPPTAAGNDELNLYADLNGITNFRFLNHDVIFRSANAVTGGMSYMGFNAGDRSVQIREDFATSTAQPGGHLAKLYTETATNAYSPALDIAIWGNNTQSYASTTSPVGVRGDVY